MNKITGIYKLTFPTGKVYIGQSRNVHKRWKSHTRVSLSESSPRSSKIINALRKYGFPHEHAEIIETFEHDVCQTTLDEAETKWIEHFNAVNEGYNSRISGKGGQPSEESRRKMSESARGKILSKEHRQHLSDTLSGRKLSESHKQKLSESKTGKAIPSLRGRPLTEECKAKISVANKGQKKSDSHMSAFQEASRLAKLDVEKMKLRKLRVQQTWARKKAEKEQKIITENVD